MPAPSLPVKYDFRETSGYVTDPSGTTFVGGTNTFIYGAGAGQGWEENLGASQADRDSTLDPRLAGINYASPGTFSDFRVDLSAPGSYFIRAAFGDGVPGSFTIGPFTAQILDTSSVLATPVNNASLPNAQWYDASGVLRTSSTDWANNNAGVTLTFSTTILRVRVSAGASTFGVIAYLLVDNPPASATQLPFNQYARPGKRLLRR